MKLPVLATLAACCLCPYSAAQAQEAYLRAGLPGIGIGYAQSVSPSVTLRGEYTAVGERKVTQTREGVNFDGRIKADQAGFYGDWFPAANGWRLTAGLSTTRMSFAGTALAGSGGSVTINNTTVPFGPGDSYSVEVKYPSVMPYLGLGYGHQVDQKGWGMIADVGAFIGRATATSNASASVMAKLNAAGVNAQAEVDAQTAKVQDSVSKLPFMPVLAVGVSYRW